MNEQVSYRNPEIAKQVSRIIDEEIFDFQQRNAANRPDNSLFRTASVSRLSLGLVGAMGAVGAIFGLANPEDAYAQAKPVVTPTPIPGRAANPDEVCRTRGVQIGGLVFSYLDKGGLLDKDGKPMYTEGVDKNLGARPRAEIDVAAKGEKREMLSGDAGLLKAPDGRTYTTYIGDKDGVLPDGRGFITVAWINPNTNERTSIQVPCGTARHPVIGIRVNQEPVQPRAPIQAQGTVLPRTTGPESAVPTKTATVTNQPAKPEVTAVPAVKPDTRPDTKPENRSESGNPWPWIIGLPILGYGIARWIRRGRPAIWSFNFRGHPIKII